MHLLTVMCEPVQVYTIAQSGVGRGSRSVRRRAITKDLFTLRVTVNADISEDAPISTLEVFPKLGFDPKLFRTVIDVDTV